jgi:DNA integrity scanning protein DisA with diadenylate cyclase activity
VTIALTRQGDLLVFDSGNLRFTCRVGRWQYWNHRHVCDLFRNRARVQHVPANVLPKVVRSIYRAALDVSFRRSGALFVLLRNRMNKQKLVIPGDAIGDGTREEIHGAFDQTLGRANVQSVSRVVLTELSSLDGGVVLDNQGRMLAYGAVLKTSGRFNPSEGSRTKAAISASRYGIAVKVSSDGDITFYEGRKVFLEL